MLLISKVLHSPPSFSIVLDHGSNQFKSVGARYEQLQRFFQACDLPDDLAKFIRVVRLHSTVLRPHFFCATLVSIAGDRALRELRATLVDQVRPEETGHDPTSNSRMAR